MTIQKSGNEITRRALLGAVAAGAVGGPLLAGCSTKSSVAQQGAISRSKDLAALVPKYVPVTYVKPDLPSAEGSSPGYSVYPQNLVQSVKSKPASGGTYTALTPAFWPIPPGLGHNDYYDAVNSALGATIKFNIVNGNDYGPKIAAVLASKQVPDLTCLPLWNKPQNFSAGVSTLFADLTDYLRGDISSKWPNLANLPTLAWEYSVWNGRLYGLPFPGGGIADGCLYRADLFAKLGVSPPTSADDWLALAKAINKPAKKRWACGDVFEEVRRMYAVPPNWVRRNGKLVNGIETEEYVEALTFNRKLFANGYVHPSIVGGNTADAKQLFESGQMLMYEDGLGAWHEALERQRPGNPSFKMEVFPPFAAAADADPVYYKGSPAGIMSFIKKGTPKDKIEELLGVMNYIAAPVGTQEYDLIIYGPRGKDNTIDSHGAPVLNTQGKKEVTYTYGFLIGRPDATVEPQYPDYVKDYHAWQVSATKHVVTGLLDGLNVEEPPKFQSLQKPLDDKVSDISRGRAPISDWKKTVATWRSQGGDRLRAFYEKQLAKAGR